MSLNKVMSLLKRTKRVVVHNDFEGVSGFRGQWIGDHYSCYAVLDMPRLDENAIFAIMGVDKEKRSKFMYVENESPPPLIESVYSMDGFEAVPMNIAILHQDTVIVPYLYEEEGVQRVCFVDHHYIKPILDDFSYETLSFLVRKEGKSEYIVIRSGFIVLGIVAAINMAQESIENKLRIIHDTVKAACNAKASEERDGA